MPRATARSQETQQNQQGNRTGPQRMSFMPAQRVGQTIPPRDIFARGQGEDEGDEEDVQDNRGQRRTAPQPQAQQQPLTKSGYPDRRFRGQRDLPPPEDQNPEFRRARTGPVVGDVHLTIDGKPDRRFKENRGLSDEEVMQQWVQTLNQQYGGGRGGGGQGRSSR